VEKLLKEERRSFCLPEDRMMGLDIDSPGWSS
jgi:hypothetical protein